MPYDMYVLYMSCRCVIAELFMDGRPLFDLSQLLEYYRKEKEATEAILKKIPDRFIRVREEAAACWAYIRIGVNMVVEFGMVRVINRSGSSTTLYHTLCIKLDPTCTMYMYLCNFYPYMDLYHMFCMKFA